MGIASPRSDCAPLLAIGYWLSAIGYWLSAISQPVLPIYPTERSGTPPRLSPYSLSSLLTEPVTPCLRVCFPRTNHLGSCTGQQSGIPPLRRFGPRDRLHCLYIYGMDDRVVH